MVPELIIAALLVGLLLRGKIDRLADANIKGVWLIFVVLVVYVGMRKLAQYHLFGYLSMPRSMVKVGMFVVLSALAVANIRIAGAKLMLVGLVANLAAVASNGGMMPVSRRGIEIIAGKHFSELMATYPHVQNMVIGPDTKLAFLCDIFPFHWPYVVLTQLYSVGDLLTTIGCFIAIVVLMCKPGPSEAKPVLEEA